ncbi:hypothetical protein LEMLEM_LOCUS4516, partial [Lemmus lemmus]
FCYSPVTGTKRFHFQTLLQCRRKCALPGLTSPFCPPQKDQHARAWALLGTSHTAGALVTPLIFNRSCLLGDPRDSFFLVRCHHRK